MASLFLFKLVKKTKNKLDSTDLILGYNVDLNFIFRNLFRLKDKIRI